MATMTTPAEHWEHIYATRSTDEVSWFETVPATSLRLVSAAATSERGAVIDVGAGASSLVDHLVDDGWRDITLLDISRHALDEVRTRLGARAQTVTFVATDVLTWVPERAYDVWHDRAV